jgi:cobalt-zinc-cadmium efflux system outer membrane protein
MFCCLLISSALAQASDNAALSNWLDDALKQHPQLQAAQAAIDAAQSQTRAAQQPLFNPELEFEYEKTDVKTRSLGISQTIDWGDKRTAFSRIASHELSAHRFDFQVVQQQLAIELLSALAAFQVDADIQQVADKRQQLMSQFIDIARRRQRAGDLPQIELDLAQLASAEASFVLANAHTNKVASQQALHGLLGVEAKQDLPSLPTFPAIPDAPDYPVADRQMLLDNLPAMLAVRSQMEIKRAQVQLRQRQQRPDPTIGLQAGKEGDETLAGLTLSIPLFVRNNFSAEVDAANAGFIESQQQAINVRRQLSAKLTAAAQTFQINRQAWLQWQATGHNSLLQQGKLLDRLWRAGELGTTDYLVQLKQALDTEASAIEQRGRLWQSWIAWLAASGDIAGWITTNNSIATLQRNGMGVQQ